MADHFGPQLAPLPSLVAAAEATSRLRVGTFVLDNDFRHPAALAKEAATVDLLSAGRLELGIGAGWNPADYRKTGLPFEAPGVRISRLEEALAILEAYFAGDGPVSFEGRFYAVHDLDPAPRPVQRPRPPLLIGANGPRMLRLAARHADILNFPDRPPVGTSTAGNPGLGIAFDAQLELVRQTAGERYAHLELSSLLIPRVTDQPQAVLEGLAEQMHTTPEVVAAMPGTMVGSVEAIVEKLQRNRDQFDLSYPVLGLAALDAFTPIVARLAGT